MKILGLGVLNKNRVCFKLIVFPKTLLNSPFCLPAFSFSKCCSKEIHWNNTRYFHEFISTSFLPGYNEQPR